MVLLKFHNEMDASCTSECEYSVTLIHLFHSSKLHVELLAVSRLPLQPLLVRYFLDAMLSQAPKDLRIGTGALKYVSFLYKSYSAQFC